MNLALTILVAILLGPVALSIGLLWAQCLIALVGPRRLKRSVEGTRPSVAVLIPAHDEELLIQATVRRIRAQLAAEDRLLVVADNCSDKTAERAAAGGAEVIERQHDTERGKGYALAYGWSVLREQARDVLILVDADTLPEPGAIDSLARQAATCGRVTQAIYLLDPPAQASPRDRISCLAMYVKNLVRPLAMHRFNLPVPLTGSGMAFPWQVADQMHFGGSNIVEDMQMGIDLAIAGRPAALCPAARVGGVLPGEKGAARTQRTRWEHGHLQTLIRQCPRLVRAALRHRRPGLLVAAADLAIPPLSLLCVLWFAIAILSAALAWFDLAELWLLYVSVVAGAILFASILAAWARFARHVISAPALLGIPMYILAKLPIYLTFLIKRQTSWVRTKRDSPVDPNSYPNP